MRDDALVMALFDCIERLMVLLKETRAKEQAQEIYDEFFGN